MNPVATFVVSDATVQPIVDTINSALAELVPVGIGLMAVMIGVSMIPRIIYKFF